MCEFFQILLDSQPPADQPVPVTVGVDRAVAALFEADRDVLLRIQLDQFGAVVADPGNEGDVVLLGQGLAFPQGADGFVLYIAHGLYPHFPVPSIRQNGFGGNLRCVEFVILPDIGGPLLS